jgi:hypothetical protein
MSPLTRLIFHKTHSPTKISGLRPLIYSINIGICTGRFADNHYFKCLIVFFVKKKGCPAIKRTALIEKRLGGSIQ